MNRTFLSSGVSHTFSWSTAKQDLNVCVSGKTSLVRQIDWDGQTKPVPGSATSTFFEL